jgi:phenylalanyl-tRNA synthetase beta chain
VAGVTIQARSSFTEIKGAVLALARDLAWGDTDVKRTDDPAFIPGRCASLAEGNRPRGVFGEVHPEVLEAWGLAHPAMAFELHLARGPGERVRGPHAA